VPKRKIYSGVFKAQVAIGARGSGLNTVILLPNDPAPQVWGAERHLAPHLLRERAPLDLRGRQGPGTVSRTAGEGRILSRYVDAASARRFSKRIGISPGRPCRSSRPRTISCARTWMPSRRSSRRSRRCWRS